MRTAKRMLGTVTLLAAAAVPWTVHAEGLKANLDKVPWARFQARLAVGAPGPLYRGGLDTQDHGGQAINGLSLMGDYYFSRSVAAGGIASGFRATSGLIVGPRSSLWAGRPGLAPSGAWSIDRRLFGAGTASAFGLEPAADTATLPYVGIGYSGLSPRGGWSVSADLGLVALAPSSAVKLGRVVGGTQGVDELLRELRLSPVIQLGVSYAF